MKLTVHRRIVHKRVPLSISRGTQSSSEFWEVRVLHEGVEGLGEAGEFSVHDQSQSIEFVGLELDRAGSVLRRFSPWQGHEVEHELRGMNLASAALAGIDMAMHDWIGKSSHQPLWRLLGLTERGTAPLSVTIGISRPAAAQQRWVQWLELGAIRAVKLKMGSAEGTAADQALFEAIAKLLPPSTHVSVDANGGWGHADALAMCRWLAERGVDHVEQPLDPNDLSGLRKLHLESPIPILVDEACHTSLDIPRLAGACSGINIKLLKCGGIREALRMIATARAHGLRIMLGCYSQTSLGNSAANQLAALVDYLDLDSHLNLKDDPYLGARFLDSHLVNRDLPGLGVTSS